jgi:glycerol uptake facilitator-like aquaporin
MKSLHEALVIAEAKRMAWACHYVSFGPARESHRTPAVSVFAAIRTAIQATHPWIPAQFLLTPGKPSRGILAKCQYGH